MHRYQLFIRGRVTTSVPIDACKSGHHAAIEAVTDPVCGMLLEHAAARFHVKRVRQDFHFCSAHCQQEFLADQSGYLKFAPKAANAPCAAIAGRHYVCSMNSQFVCDDPGTYPNCAMASKSMQPHWDDNDPER